MKPRIFVSSTFYDLKYIREDLSNFIKAHDFEPIMFEEGDIGYTPGKPLDESCYDAMRSADMVVLIIGGNYGSPATGEKDDFNSYVSVTRNEFQTAVSQAIPVYCFIDSKVHSEYGVYETNLKEIEEKKQNINFKVTKNINVFRFIREIKNFGAIPIIDFDKSIDIKDYLSKQWADMFKNYLQLLKENKQIGQLQAMMVNIQSLIEQMSIMVNGVGQKVIDEEEFEKVKEEQVIIQVKNICNKITNLIRMTYMSSASEIVDKKELVTLLINFIRKEYEISIRDGEKYEPDVSDGLWLDLINRNIKVRSSTFDPNYLTQEIYNALNNDFMRTSIISALTEDAYFNKIFVGLPMK